MCRCEQRNGRRAILRKKHEGMQPERSIVPALASIGTSGFSYGDWKGTFYPDWMPSRDWFHFYATRFNAVEINLTFYRPATRAMLERWKASAPPGFCFVLKASQAITHEARMVKCGEEVAQMIRDDSPLGPSLSCILFQLPPSLRRDTDLLSRFIRLVADRLDNAEVSPRLAFEFRHGSWNTTETLELLSQYGCAMVVHDMAGSGGWKWEEGTLVAGGLSLHREGFLSMPLPLLYLRFHGTAGKYAGAYGAAGLAPWSELAHTAAVRGIPLHVYFNNTQAGAAVADALEFGKLLAQK